MNRKSRRHMRVFNDAMLEERQPTVATPRAEAVKELLVCIDRLVIIGPVQWSLQKPNVLALAINNVLRRQREALGAAVVLAEAGQGHLAVSFVRPALEEWLWLAYLCGLDSVKASELILAMGRYDGRRSLRAQQAYVGDEVMTTQLWYPAGFVEAQVGQISTDEAQLKKLGIELGWGKGKTTLPTGRWIAEQVGEEAEYEYLHAATSRALHFSVGEVMRRGWGTPGGDMTTDHPGFREHLSEFALDRLWRLWASTFIAVMDHLESAGIASDETLELDPEQLFGRLLELGKVPLVHAHEWNLTPEGPLNLRH